MRRFTVSVCLLSGLLLAAALLWWSPTPGETTSAAQTLQLPDVDRDGFSPAERTILRTLSPPPALPADTTNKSADSEAAALLGQKLFFEPRLSGPIQAGTPAEGQLGEIGEAGKIACRNCHMPESKWLFDIRSN